jgi:hypothetical protein
MFDIVVAINLSPGDETKNDSISVGSLSSSAGLDVTNSRFQ